MAGSINKVILVGNLGKDPEIRFTQSGSRMASFPLATNDSWKDKVSGERREKTEWHRVIIMNEKLAEIVEKYLHKGSKIYLEGQLQTRKWTDSNQAERFTTEVVLSSYRGELVLLDRLDAPHSLSSEGDSRSSHFPKNESTPASYALGGNALDDLNDDIPF